MCEGLFANSRGLKAMQAPGIECGQDYRRAAGAALKEAKRTVGRARAGVG